MNIPSFLAKSLQIIPEKLNYFAQNISFLRKKLKLSQQQITDSLDIKRGTLSNYENDETEPKIDKIIDISDYFGVPIDILLRCDLSKNVHLIENREQNSEEAKCTSKCKSNCTSNEAEKPVLAEEDRRKGATDLLILESLNTLNEKVNKLLENSGK